MDPSLKSSPRPVARRALLHLALLVVLVGAACDLGGLFQRGTSPNQPQPEKRQLFNGITYERIVRNDPRPMVIHVVTVDLKTEGLKVLVTPGDPDQERPLAAQTTSQFLEKYNLDLAINGTPFVPWNDRSAFGYYPHVGDRVTPLGFSASRGTVYAQDTDEQPTLYIYQNNKASLNALVGKVYNALSGYELLLWNGDIVDGLDASDAEPRTAIGLDRPGRRLVIVIVDGRQSGYSEGATLAEMAQLLLENRAYSAMNMDGGGSSTLVIRGEDGQPEVLNSPIHGGVPGQERPVGNHLGFSTK